MNPTISNAWAASLLALCLGALGSCGKGESGMTPFDPSKRLTPVAEISALEIRATGVDRFKVCPPPGGLGQPWFPPPAPWTPPASLSSADAGRREPIDQDYITRTRSYTPSEQATEATRRDFRSCYLRGLVHDPVQDGRVAIVLRIDAAGRVARVEESAACELSADSIACMKAAAGRLRFPPPPGGSDTVVIPAVFTSRDGVRRAMDTPNNAYTAGAFVTLDSARAGLHACEEQARRDLRPLQATGTFTLTLGPDGQVSHAHVDPWTGEQSILACAARALETLRFEPPPSGAGSVIARLDFNPSQGGR